MPSKEFRDKQEIRDRIEELEFRRDIVKTKLNRKITLHFGILSAFVVTTIFVVTILMSYQQFFLVVVIGLILFCLLNWVLNEIQTGPKYKDEKEIEGKIKKAYDVLLGREKESERSVEKTKSK